MKKVSELTGAELDYWVAKAGEEWKNAHRLYPTMTLDPTFKGVRIIEYGNGKKKCILEPSNPMRQDPQKFDPSENWSIGGPIIERDRISVYASMDEVTLLHWTAVVETMQTSRRGWIGPTPLVAAMRAFVASKYGQEVGE